MVRKIIQPNGQVSFFGTQPVPVQRTFTETEVKEAICAFVIDYFFDEKGGEMREYNPTDKYPEDDGLSTVTEDRACDLVGEFWRQYCPDEAKLLMESGFSKLGREYINCSPGVNISLRKVLLAETHTQWILKRNGRGATAFQTLQEALARVDYYA